MGIKVGDVLDVRTERLAYGGDAIARHGNMVLFIPYAAPDEFLRVRVVNVKKTFARAVVQEIIEPSPERREPPCRYFGVCGGCQLQHISYEAQLNAKAGFIRDSLSRIGHIDWPHEIEILPSPEFEYRNRAQIKVQYPHGSHDSSAVGPLVGLNKHGSHSVCDIESCPILEPRLNAALAELRRLAAERSLSGSVPGAVAAELKNLPPEVEIATGDSGVSFAPQFSGLPGGAVSRTVGSSVYKFTPEVFFQSNSFLLERLVRCAAGDGQGRLAVDLYCGAGLFTGALARTFGEVLGIESDRAAAALAVENMTGNGIANVRIINDSAENFARDYAGRVRHADVSRPDLLILDPPRTGAAEALSDLVEIAPENITYVSCDPTTLARDLRRLIDGGYVVHEIIGLDLFPQTYHVETIARMARKV
ncbi:MAG TPA: class I SAM-dependent RNA methyltransferase [Blastocatellia bacterium]|nr:class I SAM-dependent RNA methyltransferase [Blastocatellia bacterium]